MDLGVFSASLTVKDLEASKAFYEKLGFEVFAGSSEMNYLIMKNKETLIGLFHGMFDTNILTFNPGWDSNAQTLPEYQDVREIQQDLEAKGISLDKKVEEGPKGPANIVLKDPDGNVILIDQHV